ncbi:hypothetical protein Tco_0603494 [Tanacetum coccineum]
MELITPNLICPSTHQLLQSFGGDSGPDMSLDKSASLERSAIPDSMVWRHPSAVIDNPHPYVGYFSMADVHHLSAHMIKLRDISEGVLVLSSLSHVWKSHVCDPVLRGANRNGWTGAEVQEEPHHNIRPTLQRLPFYYTPPTVTDAVISDPTLEDLVMGTPSVKIIAKDEASEKRKASTSGATSIYVAKHTRFTLAQLFNSTTRLSLFVDDSDDESDDDGDACVEIPLVTFIHYATVILSLGNQGESFVAPFAKGPGTRDTRGKGIMFNDADAPSAGASRPRPSFGSVPSFRDVFRDVIHVNFFLFYAGPQYATYPEGDECVALHDVSHGGELLARYHGLLRSHHELQTQVVSLNDKLSPSDVAFAKSKAKGKVRKKKIKSLSKSLDQLNAKVARLSTALNQATVLEAEKDEEILRLKATPSIVQGKLLSLAASTGFERSVPLVAQTDYAFLNKISELVIEPLSIILQLEPGKLVRLANVPASRDARVSPPIAKESTMTPASESLEFSVNVVLAPSHLALARNEEWVNAMVDVPDTKMTGGATHAMFGSTFVQGTSYVLDDVAEVIMVGSGRVSSDLADVVVALFAGEKGDGSLSSSAASEEATANPSKAYHQLLLGLKRLQGFLEVTTAQDLIKFLNEDDLEAMDLKWQLSLLSVKAKKYYQRTGKKIFINANNIARYDKSKCDGLLVKLNESEFKATTYKRGLATLEDKIITYKKNEVLFTEEIGFLKRKVACKDYEINMLKSEFEKVKQENDGIEFKIEKFDKASKDLDQLLGSQITNKSKKVLRYSAVPPPHLLIYNRPKKLDLSYSGLDEFKEPEFKGYGSEVSKK